MNNINTQETITRFAPSPTGTLHLGGYRTALFSWLYARQQDGRFILRIEDTDTERNKHEYEENIFDSLTWLGLTYDKLYRQSENVDRHKECLNKLIESGYAYVSQEETTHTNQRSQVIRFKNPNTTITFTDTVRGDVTFDTTDLGDFVIAKSLEEPLFHLAVVVDDYDEGITHVIRGEDHISNTPRQILLQEALHFDRPIYAHIPLILAPDKSKLSKRNGALAVTSYREEGFLPDALLNFMALLGWNPGTEQEVFTPQELLSVFSMERVHRSGAVFNEEKLRYINKQHIVRLSDTEFDSYTYDYITKYTPLDTTHITKNVLTHLRPLLRERIETFKDIHTLVKEGELDWYFARPTVSDPSAISWKENSSKITQEHLSHIYDILHTIDEEVFDYDSVRSAVWPYANEQGRGDVLWPMRYALSGKEKSPDPFDLAHYLGKDETLQRIKQAINML